MNEKANIGPVPSGAVPPGFEGVYTGRRSRSAGERVELVTTLFADGAGNELRRWPVFGWTMPGGESDWDDEIKLINDLERRLGPLDVGIRQIRAHIGSLVPCDSGFPVTVDELLYAIGRGELPEPSFRNGCWMPGMWWDQRSTQPGQMESMKTVYAVLSRYRDGDSNEALTSDFPGAKGFIDRTFLELGPRSRLSELQELQIERVLLTVECFTKSSDTVPVRLFSDASKMTEQESQARDLFVEAGGRGALLDEKISARAGLPPIRPLWNPEYKERLEDSGDARRKDLYRTCCAIASGVCTLSDCHHNTFRFIESWIHGIGTGKLDDPTRKSGTERERLGRLLFGYVLGLDRWLEGVPMQFLLMDLGHVDLGFDPKNEILRVYAYLGEGRSTVTEWLVACLWHNLSYSPVDPASPAGLVRHEGLLKRAAVAGISLRRWMDSRLEARRDDATP